MAEDFNRGLQPAASGSNAANDHICTLYKGKFHYITYHKGRNRKQRHISTLSLTSALNVFICLDIYVYIIIVFLTLRPANQPTINWDLTSLSQIFFNTATGASFLASDCALKEN